MILLPSLLVAASTAAASQWSARDASAEDGSFCSVDKIAAIVSNFSDVAGVTYDTSSITAELNSNYTATPDANGPFFPTASGSFCNVTFSLSHINLDDKVGNLLVLADLRSSSSTGFLRRRASRSAGSPWAVAAGRSVARATSPPAWCTVRQPARQMVVSAASAASFPPSS